MGSPSRCASTRVDPPPQNGSITVGNPVRELALEDSRSPQQGSSDLRKVGAVGN